MKKLILFLLILSLTYASLTGCKEIIYKPDPEYNVNKDEMINEILYEGKITYKEITTSELYEIQFSELKITVLHFKAIPFEQKEEWHYMATKIGGESVLLEGMSVDNKLSPQTYEKIKNICLNYKKTL